MVKILHTSDWHIGKKIYGVDLVDDHKMFFKWLINFIEKHNIDLLLISGDIFDLSNPSIESRTLYYNVLVELLKSKCQVIIAGGNHDSPMVLNAPSELLKSLNISVIGSLPDDIQKMFIPVKNRENDIEAVVVAVPYLREYDLKVTITDETYDARADKLKKATCQLYNNLANHAKTMYNNIPLLAMGHMLAFGLSTTESERELQIGCLDALEINKITQGYDYLALGHLHRPQTLTSEIPAIYAGSPISLSFSERTDKKSVTLITVTNGKIADIQKIEIPKFRNLERISGSIGKITEQLNNRALHSNNLNTLQTLIELEIETENHRQHLTHEIQQLIDNIQLANSKIIKYRILFQQTQNNTEAWAKQNIQINELKPEEIFEIYISNYDLTQNHQTELKDAFNMLLNIAVNNDTAI